MIEEYERLKELAINIWKKFYQDDSPNWEPLDDVLGVITQIDNMVCGLERPLNKAVEHEQARTKASGGQMNNKSYEWVKEEMIALEEAGYSKYNASLLIYQQGFLDGMQRYSDNPPPNLENTTSLKPCAVCESLEFAKIQHKYCHDCGRALNR